MGRAVRQLQPRYQCEYALVRSKSQPSLKKRLEDKNRALCSVNQLLQRWEHRITPNNLRLAERFLNLELHILLHLRIIETGIVWGVLLEKELPVEPRGVQKEVMSKREQSSMLINAVKLVNAPERIIPAFVWLEPIQSFYDLWPDAVYNSGLTGFVTIQILANRKVILCGNSASCNQKQAAHQVVEGASQIVRDVACPSEHFDREARHSSVSIGSGETLLEFERGLIRRAISTLQVSIGDNYVSALCGQDVGCEILEVLFGPFNFYADQNESLVGAKQRVPPVHI